VSYSLIDTVRRVLMEDAGLSSDGVATNNAGRGEIDGIGVGSRPEPGVDPRRRKRRLLRRRVTVQDRVREELARFDHDEDGNFIGNSRLGEDRVRAGGESHINYLLRLGLADDPSKLAYYRQAVMDPDKAMNNPMLRKYVADVLERILNLLFTDAQFFNRFRTVLKEKNRPHAVEWEGAE
jgi:hypothetical protein